MNPKTTKYLFIIILFFGLIYSLISIVNHYYFRTYALDLGLYTHALFNYGHFKPANSLMIKENFEYLLADHFDLYLIIFSPLHFVFGTYTLLLVQIAGILLGSWGVYRYFKLTCEKTEMAPLLASVYFLLFYGIYSAVSFDYHSNVVAAMIIPWFFLNFKLRKYLAASLLLLLVLVSKENIALWMIFICAGLMFDYRKDKKALTYLTAYTLFSLVYFVGIIYVVIPALANSNKYDLFAYSALGNTPAVALKNLILHPVDNFIILFNNHNNSPAGDYVKLEMHILVLISGLYLLVRKPQYLLMLVPVYFQKLFHDNYLVWGIDGQYSIEFAPILAIGVFTVIHEIKNRKTARIITAIVFIGVSLATFRLMDNTVLYTNKSKIRIYQAKHYQRSYDVKAVHEQLKRIPKDAIVSAQSPFVPHLALRDKIYQFPIVKDAEYIVLSEKEGKYPLDEASFKATVSKMMMSGEWEINYESEDLVILKRTAEGRR
jgi:uncharacterized membrane protein